MATRRRELKLDIYFYIIVLFNEKLFMISREIAEKSKVFCQSFHYCVSSPFYKSFAQLKNVTQFCSKTSFLNKLIPHVKRKTLGVSVEFLKSKLVEYNYIFVKLSGLKTN